MPPCEGNGCCLTPCHCRDIPIATDQDTALDDLSRAVSSTKNIAVAIAEELDLQHRLLVRDTAASGCPTAPPVT